MRPLFLVLAGVLLTLLVCQSTLACPACYGAKDSPMTAGMNDAILAMLGIIGFVLSAIVACFLVIWRRNNQRKKLLSNETFITDDGVLKTKNSKGVFEWNNY